MKNKYNALVSEVVLNGKRIIATCGIAISTGNLSCNCFKGSVGSGAKEPITTVDSQVNLNKDSKEGEVIAEVKNEDKNNEINSEENKNQNEEEEVKEVNKVEDKEKKEGEKPENKEVINNGIKTEEEKNKDIKKEEKEIKEPKEDNKKENENQNKEENNELKNEKKNEEEEVKEVNKVEDKGKKEGKKPGENKVEKEVEKTDEEKNKEIETEEVVKNGNLVNQPEQQASVFGKEEGVIYFINSKNWPAVNFYVWTESPKTEAAGKWPGAVMNDTGKKYGDFAIYSARCEGGYEKIIFSNGKKNSGEQTGDLNIGESCWYSTDGPIDMPENIIDSGQ